MSITQRIDAITAIPAEYRGEILPAPRSVKIELTGRCNFRCAYCVRSVRREPNRDMDHDFYRRLIRDLAQHGVEEVGLFYIGEPFLTGWLPEAIREAKAAGIKYVFLTSNFSQATPDRVEACMAAGLDSLKFSCNYADFEQFKAMARVPQRNYVHALANLKAARLVRDRGGYKCRLYASSIEFDGEQGERMRALVHEHVDPYVDEHYLLPLYKMGGASEAAGLAPSPGNRGRAGALRDPLPCWSVTTGHVTADGKLSACCFGIGIDGDLIMGDLNTQTFFEAWNSPKFQLLRAAHLRRDVSDTPCENCVGG